MRYRGIIVILIAAFIVVSTVAVVRHHSGRSGGQDSARHIIAHPQKTDTGNISGAPAVPDMVQPPQGMDAYKQARQARKPHKEFRLTDPAKSSEPACPSDYPPPTAIREKPGAECKEVLKQIGIAKEQWAMDNCNKSSDTPSPEQLGPYMGVKIKCPNGGAYTINSVGTDPACTVHGSYYKYKATPYVPKPVP